MSIVAPSLILVALLVLAVVTGIRRVPEGSAYTVHRFGRYARTLPPGFGFVLPMIERIGQRVSLIGHAVPVGDGSREGAVYYQILDPRQSGAAIESIDQLVARTAGEALVQISASESADTKRDQRFRQQLNGLLAGRGLHVVRCILPAGL